MDKIKQIYWDFYYKGFICTIAESTYTDARNQALNPNENVTGVVLGWRPAEINEGEVTCDCPQCGNEFDGTCGHCRLNADNLQERIKAELIVDVVPEI